MKKIINQYKLWNPSKLATIVILLMPFLFYFFIDFKIDNDFWFLVNTGKEIVRNGFIVIEPFTIHEGLFFIAQQWLTDIIFYFLYKNFDIYGMYFLVLLVNTLVIFLFYKITYLMSGSRKRALLITAILDLLVVFVRVLTTRPQMFDLIVFSLELLFLELYIKNSKKKYLYFIPLLSLFLINAHASMWLMIFVLMIPYYIEYYWNKYKKKKTFDIMPLIIVSIVSLVCGLINPYGIEAIKYFFNSYGIKKIDLLVNEMKQVTLINNVGIIVYMVIASLLYSFYYNKGNNKIRHLLLMIGIIFLTLQHYKSFIYLLIICPIILGNNFNNERQVKEVKSSLLEKIIYVTMIVSLLGLVIFKTNLSDGVDIKEFADYLDKNASYDIKLFTDYNNGSYMEYRGYKCYIDPRAEVFLKSNNKKEDIYDEYYNLYVDDINIEKFLDKYHFDYLLVDNKLKYLLKELQNNSEYEEVLSKKNKNDEKTYLFKRIKEVN